MPVPPSDPTARPASTKSEPGRDEPLGGASPSRIWQAFDQQELRRAKAGDPEALGRFFDHYFPRIFALIHRFLGNHEAAKDLTQDVFLKVRRHMSRLDVEDDPAPWLYTVALNACKDYRRSTWWRILWNSTSLDSESVTPELRSAAPNPKEEFLAAEEERRVQTAIVLLPADLRASVLLHDFDGLPHDVIGRITGTSHAAARKRYSRALVLLAELLQEGAHS